MQSWLVKTHTQTHDIRHSTLDTWHFWFIQNTELLTLNSSKMCVSHSDDSIKINA